MSAVTFRVWGGILPWIATGSLLALVAGGCGDDDDGGGAPVEQGRCIDFNPLRNVYFGDLHVHTTYSFDAQVFDVSTTPEQAYRFAKGEELKLPPLGSDGQGTQTLRLQRPLDFAAVTDHSEFIGEVEACTTPGSFGYDSESCQTFRAGGSLGQTVFGISTVEESPMRLADVCGEDGSACRPFAGEVWRRTIDAANAAYDRSENCQFTAMIGYEYTANTNVSTLHRNVLFRNDHVPFPTSYIEQPTPQGLWRELEATCLEAGIDCDVLAIPHNSNESNGNMFYVEYPGATSLDEERVQAERRRDLEPVMEVYQHKGDSECMNGLSGIVGAPDELCGFEKRPRAVFEDCGEVPGSGGVAGGGCYSRLDFLRGALLAGLQEDARLGVNPYRLGVIASTDTHNGAPGSVEEQDFIGHRGSTDDTLDKRLGPAQRRSGPSFSPGGLAGIWAEENTRESLFDALRRREVFGTSGPRIAVRFFGGWQLEEDLCADPEMIAKADRDGVPMGSVLPQERSSDIAPTFLVTAMKDAGTEARPGADLQRLQIIKGWITDGEAHQQVFDVAGDPNNGASVDSGTCERVGTGAASLCSVWTDPDFDPTQHAFYYARVIENPSCRWNAYSCLGLTGEERPEGCDDPEVAKTVQERAWTSPIWYRPG